MATDKKHIAVYLDPTVEQALVTFCQQRGLISKKGTMYSAGVNAALAAFFEIADIDNILQSSSNTPSESSNTPTTTGNIPGNISSEVLVVEAMPGKSEPGDSVELPKVDSEVTEKLQKELGNLKAENEALRQELAEERQNHEAQLAISRVFNQQVQELRSQLETLQTAQPLAEFELPDPADALNQLKAMYKGSKANLRDVKVLWGMIEG
jgi:hypothetical protein